MEPIIQDLRTSEVHNHDYTQPVLFVSDTTSDVGVLPHEDVSQFPQQLPTASQQDTEGKYAEIDPRSGSNSSHSDSQSRLRGVSNASERPATQNLPPPPRQRPPSVPPSDNTIPPLVGLAVDSDRRDAHSSIQRGSIRRGSNIELHLQPSVLPFTQSSTVTLNAERHSDNSTVLKQNSKCSLSCGCCSRKILYFVGGIGLLAMALAAAITYFLVIKPNTNSPLPYPQPYSNETYDCVNGSKAKVLLDGVTYKLTDLHLPNKQPTLTVSSYEYLFVASKTSWWYALKYCVAWCGYLVSIQGKEENDLVVGMVRRHQSPKIENYWIGFKGWKGGWYLDDESTVEYANFEDGKLADEAITRVTKDGGCVKADINGVWSTGQCNLEMHPFVCERNTADEHIRRTPFYPHQEKECAKINGVCKYASDCVSGQIHKGFCPTQTGDIVCCKPRIQKPLRIRNSTVKICRDAGGVCNHVDADECRNGRVVYNLPEPCPDHPRLLECCVLNEDEL